MKTITKNVYSFKELIELADQGKLSKRAVEVVRDILQEWHANSATLTRNVFEETWKPVLEAVGFTKPEVSWTGFYSQGDGASFTSKCDSEKLIAWFTEPVTPNQSYDENNLLPWLAHRLGQIQNPNFATLKDHLDEFSLKVVRRSHHYSHEKTCFVEADFNCSEELDETINEFVKEIEELRLSISKFIYRDLDTENESLSSEEALIEFDAANDFQWDEFGNQE
jgi:hypothetical protein